MPGSQDLAPVAVGPHEKHRERISHGLDTDVLSQLRPEPVPIRFAVDGVDLEMRRAELPRDEATILFLADRDVRRAVRTVDRHVVEGMAEDQLVAHNDVEALQAPDDVVLLGRGSVDRDGSEIGACFEELSLDHLLQLVPNDRRARQHGHPLVQ